MTSPAFFRKFIEKQCVYISKIRLMFPKYENTLKAFCVSGVTFGCVVFISSCFWKVLIECNFVLRHWDVFKVCMDKVCVAVIVYKILKKYSPVWRPPSVFDVIEYLKKTGNMSNIFLWRRHFTWKIVVWSVLNFFSDFPRCTENHTLFWPSTSTIFHFMNFNF